MRLASFATLLAFALFSVGCEKPAEKAAPAKPADNPPPAAAASTPPAPNPAPMPAAAPMENPAKQSLNEKLTTTIVDAVKAKAENPNLVVKQKNEMKGSDPLTLITKGYFAIGSQAQILAMQHSLELMKAQDDKNQYPDFETFKKMLDQSNVRLTGLYRWQVYGYDQPEGAIVILEDPEKKKAEYVKAGLDPNTAP